MVDWWKALLLNGEYVQTHQGVCFLEDGALGDGQHRLTAISEMPGGGGFDILVTRGLSVKAFEVIDNGVKRTAADALKEDRRIVETAKLLAKIAFGKAGKNLTYPALSAVIDRIREPHDDLLHFCGVKVRTWTSAPCRAAAVVSMLTGLDAAYAKATYRALAMSDFDRMSVIAKSMYRSQVAGKATTADSYDMLARMLKVCDSRNAALTKIQILKYEDMTTAVKRALGAKLTLLK
jgi:hypothetical protein